MTRRRKQDPPPRRAKPARTVPALWSYILLALWAVLVLVLVFRHEPWRDEADSWLAARDLGPAGLFRFAAYVGVPALWTFLLAPLAKLGAPYVSLGLLNAVFAGTAVALFLLRAPFPWVTRALFAFSYFASYEYGVIARSYALGMALLFGLAALHARRLQAPIGYAALLFLLLNTNVHGAIVAAPILAVFVRDAMRERTRWVAAGAAFAGLGAILAAIQLIPPADGQLPGLSGTMDASLVPMTLTGALFPTAGGPGPATVLASILFIAAVFAVSRAPRARFVLLAASAGLWGLFLFKYAGSVRHWGFLLLAMLYALWIARVEEKREAAGTGDLRDWARKVVTVALPVSLAWSVYVASEFWRRDFSDPFSGSRAMALYIREHRLTGTPIAAWPAPQTEALLPYLPGVRFYYPGHRAWGTHMTWDSTCVAGWTIPEDEVVRRVEAAFPGREVLLLANQPLPSAVPAGFKPVHGEYGGKLMMGDEMYFLYRRAAP